MREFLERLRDNRAEGLELWCWYSRYERPNWNLSVWLGLDKWGLGVETELDPGGCFDGSARRRFYAITLGPLSFVAYRESDVR